MSFSNIRTRRIWGQQMPEVEEVAGRLGAQDQDVTPPSALLSSTAPSGNQLARRHNLRRSNSRIVGRSDGTLLYRHVPQRREFRGLNAVSECT
jgi:hypothetical protein